MAERGHPLLLLTLSSLLTLTALTAAVARERIPEAGAVTGLRHVSMRNGFIPPRIILRHVTAPVVTVWPYPLLFDTSATQTYPSGSGTAADPYVIVIADRPPPAPTPVPPQAQPAGDIGPCHPIPNGYHCDVPHSATQR